MEDIITYSKKIRGNNRNHQFEQRFDKTPDGYVGIQQYDGDKVADRVLLSPLQVKALIEFVTREKE